MKIIQTLFVLTAFLGITNCLQAQTYSSRSSQPLLLNINPEAVRDLDIQNLDLDSMARNTSYGGKYYALLIGVSEYEDKSMKLIKPMDDARNLGEVLTKFYNFDPKNILILQNPKRADIIQAFTNLRNTITSTDNLLIFYAGHGYFDVNAEQGYWLPKDATRGNRANWVSNSDVKDYIKVIKSRHTLLITDACFGGSIFSTSRSSIESASSSIKALYVKNSRQAITSGNLSEVPDNSVFLRTMLEQLKNNTKKFISAGEFFGNLKVKVMDESAGQTTPQAGVIQGSGHDGGDFIFIKRR